MSQLLASAYRTLYALHYAVKYGLMRFVAYFYFEPVFRSRYSKVGKNLQLWTLPHVSGCPQICIGNYVNIYGEWSVRGNSTFDGSTLEIGNKVEVGHQVSFVVNGGVVIEDYVNIAGGTTIGDSDPYWTAPFLCVQKESSNPQGSKPTRICARAWIGRRSFIAKGVTIGEGAIVGTNSVVISDVPAFSVVAGNPARVILKDTRAKAIPQAS